MKIKALFRHIKKKFAFLFQLSAWRETLAGNTFSRNAWDQTDGFKKRQYKSYDEYITHQRSKLGDKLKKEKNYFTKYDKLFYTALHSRLGQGDLPSGLLGKSVLCLAARLGTEVRAFLDRGAFAVGIDLNPGGASKYVLEGDFHQLQFPEESVDVVYTNSLDHLYDKDKLAKEILRVLKKKGFAIIEAFQPNTEVAFGSYESFVWNDIREIEKLFCQRGFFLSGKTTFRLPWSGTRFIFEKS